MQSLLGMGQCSGHGLVALIMHGLQAKEILTLGRCSTQLGRVLASPSAWQHCPTVLYDMMQLCYDKLRMSTEATRYMPVRLQFMIYYQDWWIRRLYMVAQRVRIVSLSLYDEGSFWQFNEESVTILQSSFFGWLGELYHVSASKHVVSAIAKLPRLHTLVFNDECQLKPLYVEKLRCVPSLTSLTYSDCTDSSLEHVARLPTLTELTIRRATLAGVVRFCQIIAATARFTRFHVQMLQSTRSEPANAGVLEIGNVGIIHTLSIGYCDETRAQLLAAFLHTASLRRVHLSNLPDLRDIAAIERLLVSNPHVQFTLGKDVCLLVDLWANESRETWSRLQQAFPQRLHGP
jgi:hypothetical protein